MTRIESVLEEANLSQICNPLEGDCESVAVALHRVFDAESFVCIYDPTTPERPVHATAKIDGTIYDGNGTRTRDGLLDHVSYLKPKDFHTQISTYEEMYNEIESEGLIEFDTGKYGTSTLKYDEHLVQEIVSRLENQI